MYAIDIKTHQPVWHKNIWKGFGGGELPRWAIVQNPLIYGNWVIDAGDGHMLITGAYGAGAAMIKVQKKEDGSYGVTELYKNPDFGAHTHPPILSRRP